MGKTKSRRTYRRRSSVRSRKQLSKSKIHRSTKKNKKHRKRRFTNRKKSHRKINLPMKGGMKKRRKPLEVYVPPEPLAPTPVQMSQPGQASHYEERIGRGVRGYVGGDPVSPEVLLLSGTAPSPQVVGGIHYRPKTAIGCSQITSERECQSPCQWVDGQCVRGYVTKPYDKHEYEILSMLELKGGNIHIVSLDIPNTIVGTRLALERCDTNLRGITLLLKTDKYSVCGQLITAIMYLHENGVYHRDLRPENILINLGNPNPPLVKVCDFGHSYSTSVNPEKELIQTTRQYNGPYMNMLTDITHPLHKALISQLSDLWSLCLVLYEILSGLRYNDSSDGKTLINLSLDITDDIATVTKKINYLSKVYDPIDDDVIQSLTDIWGIMIHVRDVIGESYVNLDIPEVGRGVTELNERLTLLKDNFNVNSFLQTIEDLTPPPIVPPTVERIDVDTTIDV